MANTEATGRIVHIGVNPKGGVPKHAVREAYIAAGGVVGDKQRHLDIHGGPERAVCLFSWQLIRELQDEGHPIDCGSTGENLTLDGIDWQLLAPGARLGLGEDVELEITRYTTPCTTIAASFVDGYFNRISHKLYPGWSRVYARVLKEGIVRVGMGAEILR